MKLQEPSSFLKRILTIMLLGIVGGSVWGLFQLKPQETIEGLVPASLREQVTLFERSPFNRKLFAIVTAPDESVALEQAQNLRAYLLKQELIKPGFMLSPQTIHSLMQALPFRFLPQDEALLSDKLTPASIRQAMQENYERLISLESFLFKPLLQQDPLHLIDLMTAKLALLNPQTHARYQDGFLTNPSGTVQVGLYDITGAADFSFARKITRAFADFRKQLPQEASAFFLGGLRYTAENVAAIERDLIKVGLLALVSLALIFGIFLRRKQALIIYLLPLAVTPLAALITYGIFGRISGITLGFGSVVAGLSVDYAVYVFFSLQSSGNKKDVRTHTRKHLISTFVTSSLCFAALFSSSIEVFHQIAVFAIVGLLLSLLAALYVFPLYWTAFSPLPQRRFFTLPICSKRLAWSICVVIFVLGILGVKYTHFSGDMQTLNASSKLFRQERAILQQVLGETSEENALIFIKGLTSQEALERSELFAEQSRLMFPTTALLPSNQAAANHIQAWQQFWNPSRVQEVKKQLNEVAASFGIDPQAFAPFWTWLNETPTTDPFDLTQIYNPLIELPDGTWAVVNIVPASKEAQAAAQRYGAIFISGPALQRDLLAAIKREAVRMVLLALLLNLVAVSILFGSFKKALWAFIPVGLAAAATFAGFWLLRIEVNLFALVFLPLLMGLGIDYGIFQLVRAEVASTEKEAYPSAALWTAALSTLAGFGVLIFAQHGVLFIMGISSFLGVGSAMLAAQFILPAFLEQTK